MEKINLTFLGTSAQIPTAKRNHSAVLLNYKDENILFDCGEGTQRQIRKAKLNPCRITKILITHWHGDHVLGLAGLLQTLSSSGYNRQLEIYGPKGIKSRFDQLFRLFGINEEIKIKIIEISKAGKFFENKDFMLEAGKMNHGIFTLGYSFKEKDKLRIDKAKLRKSKLPFGPLLQKIKNGKDVSYKGKKFKAKDLTYLESGRKVSFVMDTLVNPDMNKLARNSDVFIAESSFSEEDVQKAKDHLHLTSSQAAQVSKKTGVKRLLLTHVGQRYEKDLKKLLNPAKKIFPKTEIVEDLQVVELK